MLYQSSDIEWNKFCIHVRRFIPKISDRFLKNLSCNNFQFFAAARCVAENGSAAECKEPIRPRRLLSPTRACFAPIVNSFACVCDILKAFLWAHCSQNNFFSKSRPRWLEWRQKRRRPLRRSNLCWYLVLSPCLNLNCHWYPKCNLEAINFHWERVTMIFIVSLEIFSYLFDDMPHKGTGWAFANLLLFKHSYQSYSDSSMAKKRLAARLT